LEIAIGFVIHNIPTLILGLVVFAAWRREWIGVLSCLVLAVSYIVGFWGRFPLFVYFIMTGPPFIVAAPYAVNWNLRSHASRIP